MKIPYKTRLLLAISICTIIFIAGCVDTSVESVPQSINYSSQIKIVNLVSGAGTATITLNGQSLGTVDFGNEIPGTPNFLTIPSGNKTLNAVFAADTSDYLFAAATEYKLRVFLAGTAASNELYTQYQRYTWQTPGSANGSNLFPDNIGQVAFFNGSPDAVLNSVIINNDTTEFDNPLAMGEGSVYLRVNSGAASFDVLYNDSLHVTFNHDLMSKGRYTAVIYDAAASIKNAVFVDD